MTKKHTLSPEQDCAANPRENVWVQANAGTGKTSVLVQRLLRILFRSPDCAATGILCLTYTNAGAGEMRNRILVALRKWALASDDELAEMLDGVTLSRPITDADIAHAREIFFRYIDAPEMLKIKTLHGFCEEILHRFPIEAGVSPSWSLVSDSAQRILLQDAFDKLINSPSSDSHVYDAFAHIVGRVSETYVTDLLAILSAQYKHFFQIENIVKYREYFIDTTKKFLNIDSAKNTVADPVLLQKIIDLASDEQKTSKKPAKYLTEIINLTKQYIDKTIDFEEYKSAYLTAEGNKKSVVSKKEYLSAEQQRVYDQNLYNTNALVFADTMALFDLSAAFATRYRDEKRARNLLDFEDLILYTRKLFSNRETMGWVLSQLDVSLSHILVDEAQDTSPLQWDILRMLSGDFFTEGDTGDMPHSLFVVGDTKQSIYGFQGADPAAFAYSREVISKQIENNVRTIREVPLAQSFRSALPVLNTVDRFFADDTVIAISDFANNPHKCFRIDAPGAVELHALTAKQDDDTTIDQYTATIADRIKMLIDSGKYTAGDIMVLVQQRNPMAAPLIYQLKKRGIDVAGSDRIVLPNYPAIRDMLNLVRWCLNPTDDFSLCCVLKSPFFYLTEHDIFDLCKIKNDINSARKREDKDVIPITVFEILENERSDIYKQLTDIKNLSETASAYTFFSYVLSTNDTRHKFISALGDQVIDPLEEFMTICLSYERTQPGTLHHFLKWFITGASEIKRDMDASAGVRIVTVHGSKGLESRVVFLIDTVRMPKSENILPIESRNDMPVWLWTPRGAQVGESADARDNLMHVRMAEYYRLLYVAMTRARDELYIYGYTPHKNAPENAWHTQLWRVFAGSDTPEFIRITNEDIA